MTATTSLWTTASEAVRDFVDGVESWVSGFTAIDFVLAVAVLWAVYWIWSSLRAVTRLGPVEVSLLDFDERQGEEKPDVHALTGRFRERLANGGLLPPPEVPAGSPQTNLIAAVEASGHPQAAWVAKALELIPHPPRSPEYKLSGTVLELEPNGDGAPADDAPDLAAAVVEVPSEPPAPVPGVRYWLRPKNEGRALLETATGTDYDDAVCRAAAKVVLEISRDAVHVFPQWAQWTKLNAFLAYVDGIEARLEDDGDAKARERFIAATADQPENLLPLLQVANLTEKEAGAQSTAGGDAWARAKKQARALRRYLDIGVARSDLVAARYRAGVTAGMLASACEVAEDEQLTQEKEAALVEIRDKVGLRQADATPVPPMEVATALHDLAAGEMKDAHQLVGRFQVLFDKHRLRHRYEPTGLERRRLRRTIAISKHTLKIRRLRNDMSEGARREVRRSELLVRFLHLGLFRASAGWNAHYNAGCFFALLYDRELKILVAQEQAELEAVDA